MYFRLGIGGWGFSLNRGGRLDVSLLAPSILPLSLEFSRESSFSCLMRSKPPVLFIALKELNVAWGRASISWSFVKIFSFSMPMKRSFSGQSTFSLRESFVVEAALVEVGLRAFVVDF